MVAANRLHCLDQRVQLRHIGVWQLADDPLTEPQLANEPSATQTDSQMRRNRSAEMAARPRESMKSPS